MENSFEDMALRLGVMPGESLDWTPGQPPLPYHRPIHLGKLSILTRLWSKGRRNSKVKMKMNWRNFRIVIMVMT
jgi:hypothetical protein